MSVCSRCAYFISWPTGACILYSQKRSPKKFPHIRKAVVNLRKGDALSGAKLRLYRKRTIILDGDVHRVD